MKNFIIDMVLFYPYVLLAVIGYWIVDDINDQSLFIMNSCLFVLCIFAIMTNLLNIKFVDYNGVFKENE